MIRTGQNVQTNSTNIPEEHKPPSIESKILETVAETSELTGKMYKGKAKDIPSPLIESADSSWGEASQAKLLESEREGKGYRQLPKVSDTESEPTNSSEPTETKING